MLPDLSVAQGRATVTGRTPFRIEQRHQVAVLNDFCNECGNCTTFCPASGRPFVDKPRFYVDHAGFEAQQFNAFRIFRAGPEWVIEGRFAGVSHRLVHDGVLRYSKPGVEVELDPATFALRRCGVDGVADGPLSLAACGTLYALLRGVRDELPFLPRADCGAPG
jgi:putative selenate reductase